MSDKPAKPPAPSASAAPASPFAHVRRARLFPKTLQDAVSFPTAASLKKRGFGERNLLRDWPAIVGKEMARHCTPLKLAPAPGPLNECRLYIQAPGSYALILQHQEPQILERLTLYYGRTIAHRIVIVQ